jgi:hypothetical protein
MIIEKIHNAQTGQIEIIEREETDQEKAEREAAELKAAQAQAEAEAKAQAKAILLEKLGITEQEARLLLS